MSKKEIARVITAVVLVAGVVIIAWQIEQDNEVQRLKNAEFARKMDESIERKYGKKPKATDLPPTALPNITHEYFSADAGCQEGRVVIQNNSASAWIDVKIEVNGDYVFVADGIPPRETYRYMPSIFTKSDGTRLDLDRVACKTIDIHATVNGKREHWNGAYK